MPIPPVHSPSPKRSAAEPRQARPGPWAFALLLLLQGAACSPTPGVPPEVPSCTEGAVQIGGECLPLCDEATPCDAGLTCVEGACATDACAETPCHPNVSCTVTHQGFECGACPEGYSGDGTECVDVDECATSPCDPNASCTNAPGGFSCECERGYIGDGLTCEAAVHCQPGEFVSAAGTPTTDPECTPCPEGTYSDAPNADQCAPFSHCIPGEIETTAPSASENRACEACPPGTFSPTTDARACVPHASCEPGSYILSAGTRGTDRTCAPCAEGTFSEAANAPACTAHTSCAPGTVVAEEGSSTRNRRCKNCPADTYASVVNATTCKPHSECTPGEYILMTASPLRNRECGPCPAETYSNRPNQSACAPHTDCQPGQRVKRPGTTKRNQLCLACPAATFSDTQNAPSCQGWRSCEDGYQESVPGNATTDRTCADVDECAENLLTCAGHATCENSPGTASCQCEDGYFGNGVSACYAVANCGPGEFIAAAPTPTTNRLCQDCPEGYYNDDTNASSCQRDCTEDLDCGPNSYGCSDDGRCVAVQACPTSSSGSKSNHECTFTNEKGDDETGRCVYNTEDQALCRRTCTPETSGECTTGTTVCQKSAPWTLNQKPAEEGDAPVVSPTQGHCAAPCESMDQCIGGAYGCDTEAGTCTWPRQSSCVHKDVGASCYIAEIGSSGICAHAIWFPYAGSLTDPSGLYCSRTCGPNEAGTDGDASLCGGYRAQCGTSQTETGEDKVYNLCAPSCAQSGPVLPAALLALGVLALRRRRRRAPALN